MNDITKSNTAATSVAFSTPQVKSHRKAWASVIMEGARDIRTAGGGPTLKKIRIIGSRINLTKDIGFEVKGRHGD